MAEVATTEIERPQVITAMITPFVEEGQVDFDAAGEIADYLVNHGSDGLVVAGTTGESPVIPADQQITLFDVVREAVGDHATVIGGTGSSATFKAVDLSRQAAEHGSVDKLLVVSPPYNRPPQNGLLDYYRQVGRATDLDVILYNIPLRTGKMVERDTIRRLVDEGVVQGIKDATSKQIMATSLHEEYGNALDIYSGNDSENLWFLKWVDARGAISVASHWAGRLMQRQFQAFSDGDQPMAKRIDHALDASYKFESTHRDFDEVERDTPNPIPAKVMMSRILGREVVGNFISPMLPDPDELAYLEMRADQILEELSQFESTQAW